MPGGIEEALRDLGGAGYAIPLDPALLVDRTLVADVIGDGTPVPA